MNFGVRKPNLKKSFKARTTGKAKRMLKKAINPLYGKKGMGIIKNPQKAIYNKIYNKTTFGAKAIIKTSNNKKNKAHVKNLYKEDEKIDISKNSDENNVNMKMKKSDIIRYVIGIIFILGGIGGLLSEDDFLGGLVMIIFGITFFPIIYKLLKCPNNKVIQIITPIILFFLTVLLIQNSETVTTTNHTNSIPNENLENINTNTNVDNTTNEVNNFNTNNIQTVNKIENDEENETQKIVSNETTKKDDEISSTIEKETEENTIEPPTTNKTETTTTQITKDNSRTVYRTPTGKRYHYDPDCGGKNSYETTLNSAISSGLTPCKKCAQ